MNSLGQTAFLDRKALTGGFVFHSVSEDRMSTKTSIAWNDGRWLNPR